jgi:hypothetical protein
VAQYQAGLRKVIAVLRVEAVALFLVILVAAVLTRSAPPDLHRPQFTYENFGRMRNAGFDYPPILHGL